LAYLLLEDHYPTRLQGIRRQGGTMQVDANIPLPLASALDLEAGDTDGRRVIHFNVTAHLTSEWAAQQIAETFSWDTAPRSD
jgi:hypothetical protein